MAFGDLPFMAPVIPKVDYDLRDNEVEDYAIKRADNDYKISFIKKKEDPSTDIGSRMSVQIPFGGAAIME